MYWGASAWNMLAGVGGGALLVYVALRAARWPWRRVMSTAGGGLLLVGLSVSGLLGAVAVTVTRLAFDPLRWVGVGAAVAGVLLLSGSGALRLRRGDGSARDRRAVAAEGDAGADRPPAVGRAKAAARPPQSGDEDLSEIEDILRRRGIE